VFRYGIAGLTLALFLSCLAAMGYQVFYADGDHLADYQRLKAEANPSSISKTKKMPYTATQQQQKVRKDLFFFKKSERLHLMLTSDDVNLTLDHHQGTTELMEELSGVNCYAQDELFASDAMPRQKIYALSADRAFYAYEGNFSKAENVSAIAYETDGHTLSEEAISALPSFPLLTVESQQALYDGHNLTLQGNVSFVHRQGSIAAETATMGPQAATKGDLLDAIQLKNNVICTFQSTPSGEEWVLFADQASYLRSLDSQTDDSFHPLPGKIYLMGDDPTKVCRLSSSSGHRLHGPTIEIDTNMRQVHVAKPKGHLVAAPASLSPHITTPSTAKQAAATVDLEADALLWDLASAELTLSGSVDVIHSQLGRLKCDHKLHLHYADGSEKKELQKITAEGHTTLCHIAIPSQQRHWLTCDGTICIDMQALEATFQSALDSTTGKVTPGKQVFYYDPKGEMQADKVTLSYKQVEGKVVFTKVLLEGNVYLIDHKGALEGSKDKGSPLHYALADIVEYTPHNQEINFSSKSGQRVLFYDKINQLQMSAPALKITRDPQTKKESVKGIGDVRFHFLNSELEQLLKRKRAL
jgi:hypothetical protein